MHQHHNTYYTPNGSATFNACGDGFSDLQSAGYEVGSSLNVNITVNAVTDLTAVNDSDSTNEDTALNGDVSGNDNTSSGGTPT